MSRGELTNALVRTTLAVQLMLYAATVQAQDARYEQLVREAVAEFEAQRVEEARVLFLQAHTIAPNARTFRGIGLTSFELRDYPQAYRALSAARTETRRPLTADQRTEVDGLLERTLRFLAFYTVVLEPSSAVLVVDGSTAVMESDGRMILGIGTHTLVASAPGHREGTRTVRVVGGEEEELRLVLESESVSAAPVVRTSDDAPPPRDWTVPAVLFSAGALLAAGAIVTTVVWWQDRDQAVTSCVLSAGGCANISRVEEERLAAAATSLGLGVLALAALTTGAVLSAVGGQASDTAWSCVPSLAGGACSFVF